MKTDLPPSTPATVGILIKEVQTVLHQSMDAALRPIDLTVAQYATMRALYTQPSISSSDLARITFTSRQSTNVLVQGLEKRGLIKRANVRGTRREKPTELTSVGEQVLAVAEERIAEVVARMAGQFSDEELNDLAILLLKCKINLEED